MDHKKNNIVLSAMNYAIPLGLFWIFKYLFVILGDYSELSKYIHQFLSIGTPVLFYIILCRYRDTDRNGKIDYGDCILFSLLLFFFASILESVAITLHIFVISPEYVAKFTELMRSNSMNNPFMVSDEQKLAYENLIDSMISNMRSLIIASNIFNNLVLGLFLSLILGYFVSRQNPNQPKSI